MIYHKQSYEWNIGQTDAMTFIDSFALIQIANYDELIIIEQKKDIFYEKHALETNAYSFQDHIIE